MADKADFKISHDAPKAVSRRDFIKGVIAAGATVSSAGYLFRASSLLHGQQLAAGGGERLLTLNINGQQRRVDVMKQETLAWTLRHKLGLTGTKLGCDRAECGSCTVLSPRQESSHHRRPGEPRRHAASSPARRHR
jgi:hypothetical protein